MRLQTRLTMAFVLTGLVPLVLLSLLIYASYRTDVTERTLEHLESVAAVQRARVSATLHQNAERLALVTSRTQLRLSLRDYLRTGREPARERMVRILTDATRSIGDLTGISVHDTTGALIAATGPHVGRAVLDPGLLRRALAGPVVDRVVSGADGEPMALLAGPMVLDDEVLGVAALQVRVTALMNTVRDSTGLGRTGEIVLARPAGDGRYQYLLPTRSQPRAALTLFAPGSLPGAGTGDPFATGGVIRYENGHGAPVVAVNRRIPRTDWSLVVKIDEGEIYRKLDRNARITVMLVTLIGAATLAVSLRLGRRLSAPLEELSHAATAMADGDLLQNVPVTSRDEIGALETSFNAMVDRVAAAQARLQQKVDELNREIARRRETEVERERAYEELKSALAAIETLEGILPICASCKKIRDDKGYWNQLESYLSEHSRAIFSHGLCPECYARSLAEVEGEADSPDPPGAPG
jgi:HAMP domain-containing protein